MIDVRMSKPALQPAVVTVLAGMALLYGTAHAKLVVSEEIVLSSAANPLATIRNTGGEFTAQGWKSTASENLLHVQLARPLTAGERGAIELHVTNFDLAKNLPSQLTNFYSVYASPEGNPVEGTPGPFVAIQIKGRTSSGTQGYACTQKGRDGQGMKAIYKSSKGERLSNGGQFGCNAAWDASKTYKFRWEFTGKRAILYRNDLVLYGLTDFPRPEDLAHVFLGHDKSGYTSTAGSFPGVVYKKLVVYRDDDTPDPVDPLMQERTIKINCGASDDQVEGWHSDVLYAFKGKEYWWNQRWTNKTAKNPAPLDVYRSIRHRNSNFDTKTSYEDSIEYVFPIADGGWTVRLHFIDRLERFKRSIDVDLNGKKVIDNMDIRTVAGGHLKALSRDFPVTISGGTGLTVVLYDDVNDRSKFGTGDFIICGIELMNNTPTPALPVPRAAAPAAARMAAVDHGGTVHLSPGFTGAYAVRIVDAAGRCCLSRTLDGPARLDTGLEPGWYHVRILRRGERIESTVMVRP